VAILSIFRVITLEGWSYVMYNYMDGGGIMAAVYFPILVVIGGFFLLNLFLAVIMEAFSEMSSLAEKSEIEENGGANGDNNNSADESMDAEAKAKAARDKEIANMIAVTKKKLEL
jgi:Ion transport protein